MCTDARRLITLVGEPIKDKSSKENKMGKEESIIAVN